MIPTHMKVNKSDHTPPKELVDAILKKCVPLLIKSIGSFDYCYVDNLFIAIEWRGFPLARVFKRWHCITVDVLGRRGSGDYRLVQYHDFTRVYNPGEWEKTFMNTD